ncbi:hypothetical protein IL306_008305 [Fusarium sp. DS 682]|nr:hypothetical protein IL306_008305 [Fusarium sp. DS 682]
MGSSKPSKKKKPSSREGSMNFEVPLFSDFNAPRSQNSRETSQDSSHSWMNEYLTPDTSTSQSRLNHAHTEGPINRNSPNVFEKLWGGMRDQIVDIKEAGTGHHDNRMAKNPPGQFREPSLRRGYGMPYQTPRVFDNVPSSQSQEPITGTQSSTAVSHVPLPSTQRPQSTSNKDAGNMYDLNQPRFRRGDLQPAGYVPIAPRPSKTYGRPSNKEPEKTTKNPGGSEIVINLGHYKKAEQKALLRACLDLKDLYLRSEGEAQKF